MPLDPSASSAACASSWASTGDENGEQRVAWTDTWAKGAWLADLLGDLPLDVERDAAGNDWYKLRGASDRAVLIGGHMDSVPNGGLARRLPQRAGGRGGPAPDRRGRDATRHGRLVDWADEGARFGRSPGSRPQRPMADQDELRKLVDRDGVPCPTRSRRSTSTSTERSTRARSRGRRRLPGAPHRAGSRARVARPAARRRARHVRRRAFADHVDGPGRARGLDADGQPPRRARRRRQAGTRDPRRRARDRRRRGLHLGRRRAAGDRHLGRGDGGAARPASPRRREARAMLARAQELAPVRRGGAGRRRLGADLVDRADPLRRDAVRFADEAIRDVAGTSHRLPRGRSTTRPRSPARVSRR